MTDELPTASTPATVLDPQRVYVHLSYGQDVEAHRRRYEMGQEPDLAPYGFHLGADHGYDLRFSRDRRAGRASVLLARIITRLLGFDPLHAFHNREEIRRADIVWTMLEVEALAVASLMWLGIVPRRPLLGSTVWMINRWNRYGAARRFLYRRLVGFFSEVFVHTEPCRRRAEAIFPDAQVRLMHFGISTAMFRRDAARREPEGAIHIVAAGNDRTRDWGVLLDAFGNDPRFRLTIVCQRLGHALLGRYNNLDLPRKMSMAHFHAIYASGTYVAVPMHENIFSGITVALEAVAMGIPVISTRTGGVPTYFSEEDVRFVPVGDAAQWRAAALGQDQAGRAAMADRAHHHLLSGDYTTAGMIGRYAERTRALLATPSR